MQVEHMTKHAPSNFLKLHWPWLLLAASVVFSLWLYTDNDAKIAQLLRSHKWRSHSVTEIDYVAESRTGPLTNLQRLESSSQTIFLPNHRFSRFTTLILKPSDDSLPISIHISESGYWHVSGGYLQVTVDDMSDVVNGFSNTFSTDDIDYLRQYYTTDNKQSRKIDIINTTTVLLTSLNEGSALLVSE